MVPVAAAAEIFHDYLDIQIAVGTRRNIDAVISAVENNKRGFYATDFKQFVRRLSAEQSRVLRTGCGAGYGTAPVDMRGGYYLAALAVALDRIREQAFYRDGICTLALEESRRFEGAHTC